MVVGVRLDEAFELLKGRVLNGYTAVISNSAYCLRRWQRGNSLEFIISNNPIFPLAYMSGRSGVLSVLLDWNGLACDSYELPSEELGEFEEMVNASKGRVLMSHEADVHVVGSIEEVSNTFRHWVKQGTAIMIAEGLGCLWSVQELTSLRVLIVKEPFFIIGVAGIEDMARAVGTSPIGPIDLYVADDRGVFCISPRFTFQSPSEAIKAINGLLEIQDTPLAQLIITHALKIH